MKLSTEQCKVLLDELRKRIDGICCGVCGARSFSLPDPLFELREFEPSKEVCGVTPLIVLTCDNCGFVLLFNAKCLHDKIVDSVVNGDGVLLDSGEMQQKNSE
jgi:hypothetical protein